MKQWQLIAIILLVLGFFAGAILPQAWSQGRGQGFRPCPYAPYVCKMKGTCKAFEGAGKIVQLQTVMIEDGMYPGMAILVDTKTQGQMLVHLGPVWYLERQEFDLHPGDEVGIKGMCDKHDSQTMVVAYELRKGNYVLSLRDAQGRPIGRPKSGN
jgi:hypothetical protein